MKLSGRREEITGYLFIAPTYLFYFAFMLLPMVFTIYYSFTEYNIIKAPEWVGLENYLDIFKDKTIVEVVKNTVLYTLLSTVLKTVLGLLLAIGLNSVLVYRPVRNLTRAAIFFPYIIAMSYVSLIWMRMLSLDMGIVNYYLNRLGLDSVPWLTDYHIAIFVLIAIDVWKNSGYGMLIFLAGLQNISKEYYEAAMIDGASKWKQIRYITLPLLRPMIVMMVILNTVNGLQTFDNVSVMTDGGPGNATRTIVMYLYEKAFESYDIGYASAISVFLILIIVAITLIQLRFDKDNSV